MGVIDGAGMEVEAGELLHDLVEKVGAVQPLELIEELIALEDVAGVGTEAVDVSDEVGLDVGGVGQQFFEVERRGVIEILPGLAEQERSQRQREMFALLVFFQHRGLGVFQHAVQPAQQGERQDHLTVVGLLVIAAQEIGDRPQKSGGGGEIHSPWTWLRLGDGQPSVGYGFDFECIIFAGTGSV